MLSQGEILTLNDNNKYVVVKSKSYNNENFIYLIQENDYTNVMFCKLTSDNQLEEVIDPNLIEKLIIEFKD